MTTTLERPVLRTAGVAAGLRAWRTSEQAGWASLVARLVLAGVFGYAAISKIGDPAASVRAVRAYRLLPEALAVPFAHALPAFELALAVLLLLGVALRLTALVTAALMTVFIGGMVSAWARGLRIDCGCFGGGGVTDDPQYLLEIGRDVGLLALAGVVAWIGPHSRWTLDPAPPPTPKPGSQSGSRRARRATAKQLAAQQRVATRHRINGLIALAALALAASTGAVTGAAARSTNNAPHVPAAATDAGGIVVGSPDAPHLVVLYEDPQCSVCARFERGSGQVLAAAVRAGRVRVEYRMRSFLGPESVRAVAALGAAADAGRFEELREALFAHQPREGTGGYTISDLISLGAGVGLSEAAYVDAVKAQTYAPWARIIDDRASRDGNVGTPELRLDGRVLDTSVALTPSRLEAALAAAP